MAKNTPTYWLTFVGFRELGVSDTMNADVLKTLSEAELEDQIHKYSMNLYIVNFHVCNCACTYVPQIFNYRKGRYIDNYCNYIDSLLISKFIDISINILPSTNRHYPIFEFGLSEWCPVLLSPVLWLLRTVLFYIQFTTGNLVSGGSFHGSTGTVQGISFEQCIRVTMCPEDPLKEVLRQYKGHPFNYLLG